MADGPGYDQVVGKVLCGAVQNLSQYNKAIAAAQQAGANEIAQFLRDVQAQDRKRLTDASDLLAGLISNNFW